MHLSPARVSFWVSISFATLSTALRNFTIVNGQIYTPGLAIVNAPQPFTPLGGRTLHLSIDVSGNGRLPPQTYQANVNGTVTPGGVAVENNGNEMTLSPTAGTFYNSINIFLSSYANGHNFTVANNTIPPVEFNTSYVPPVLSLEPGSTVKHVNWIWPLCLVRGMGEYNISFHQLFTYNSTAYYTIFDLPIMLTNDFDSNRGAGDCGLVNNPLVFRNEDTVLGFQPWVGNTGAEVVFENPNSDGEPENPDGDEEVPPENTNGNNEPENTDGSENLPENLPEGTDDGENPPEVPQVVGGDPDDKNLDPFEEFAATLGAGSMVRSVSSAKLCGFVTVVAFFTTWCL